jgi:hypothetical protein
LVAAAGAVDAERAGGASRRARCAVTVTELGRLGGWLRPGEGALWRRRRPRWARAMGAGAGRARWPHADLLGGARCRGPRRTDEGRVPGGGRTRRARPELVEVGVGERRLGSQAVRACRRRLGVARLVTGARAVSETELG